MGAAAQLANRDELQDAVLHVLQPVVVLVQHLPATLVCLACIHTVFLHTAFIQITCIHFVVLVQRLPATFTHITFMPFAFIQSTFIYSVVCLGAWQTHQAGGRYCLSQTPSCTGKR